MPLKFSAGSVAGYICGRFAKQVSDILIFWTGLSASIIAWLHWTQYITINFKKIDSDITHLVAKAKEEDFKKKFYNLKKLVMHWAPLLGGFGAAFWHAFEH